MGGGGGLIGKVTDTVGLTDYAGAEKAQKNAVNATNQASEISMQIAKDNIAFQKEQLDFTKEQYADWEKAFGSIQENLGEYYNNLSGTKYTNRALAAEAQEYSRANTELNSMLAQRGMSGSGMEAAAKTALLSSSVQNRAIIRATADDTVAQQKMNFLGLGLGQGSAMLGTMAGQTGNIGNAYNANMASQTQLYSNLASIQGSYANTALSGSLQNLGGMISSGINATGSYLGGKAIAASDTRLKSNITFIDEVNGINVYSWEWNALAKQLGLVGKATGVLAQEIADIYPEAIGEISGYLAVDYAKLNELVGV
ncbi:MAG: tail fiber domain-containing protein [Candidatus Dojkabacteria bacterium]|jgi:hypothetical protein|nr:tail fiber domain-containing protein [Candidatus Dojkabacteria bacterium]MDX9738900.1 tail fiber domain-containing protein [Candidatus Dojkabacteria bacterium]